MPALNFQSCFAPAVLAQRKRCTIRRVRKRPIRVGDRLYLYTDQRTRHARKLGEGVCTSVDDILISRFRILSHGRSILCVSVLLNERGVLTKEGLAELAREDGFDGPFDMIRFFQHTHGLPFRGVLIRW